MAHRDWKKVGRAAETTERFEMKTVSPLFIPMHAIAVANGTEKSLLLVLSARRNIPLILFPSLD